MELMEYLGTREGILKQAGKTSSKLIVSTGLGSELKNILAYLFKQLMASNKSIKSFQQVRASVITSWLREYNLRQVQYMVGHKYVSSTERYKQNNLDDLIDDISKYHPL